jgi:hypothetical protein
LGATIDDEAVRRGLRFFLRSVTAVLAGVVVSGPMANAHFGGPEAERPSDPPAWAAKAQRLAQKYDCSPHGLREGVLPARAVVLRGGKVQAVSFADGWATRLGHRPGTLVSVCAR